MDARCGLHPEQQAVAPCARCGTFLCGGCVRPGPGGTAVCAACVARLEARSTSFVGQIQVVGVLMIVHGALIGVVALFSLVGAAFGGFMFVSPELQNQPDSTFVGGILLGVYGGIAVVHGVMSALQIYGGIMALKRQRRTWVIVGLSVGLVSIVNVYCALTAIALFVYGLIVMLDASVKDAFAARERELELLR